MIPPQEEGPRSADPVDQRQSIDMDVDEAVADDGNASASFGNALTLSAAVGASEDIAFPSSTSPSATATSPARGLFSVQAGERRIDERLHSGATCATQNEAPSKDQNVHNGDSQAIGEITAGNTDAKRYPVEATESEVNESPRQLFAELSSVEQGQEMSTDNDDEDGDDDDDEDNEEGEEDEIFSEKASSYDAQSDSDAFLPLLDDTELSHLCDERAPLENAYRPFINPTDTCLEDARERLHVALEQTRLLGASFTEQAYERYRCVMKPVAESLEEIIEPILSDPDRAVAELLEQADTMKVEKDREKRQAQQAGASLEEVAYFSEGLHLVVLPEDDIDESDLDIAQFPHRGPTNPETGERVEEISASAAASTEQVFDRIRRIRAIRMGVDISEAGDSGEAATTLLKRNISQDNQIMNESYPSGFAAASYLSSSPSQSIDSNAGDSNQHSKSSLHHLLTLAPDAEGVRQDGSFTAVRSALLGRGVGMHELKHDFRINPLHQRMLHPNNFPPASSNNFLPPLLGPNQLHRLKSADARREGVEFPSSARASIKSVVEEIFAAAGGSGVNSAGKSAHEDEGKIDDCRCGGFGDGTFGLRKALHEERSAYEVGLFQQIHSNMLKSQPALTYSTLNSSADLGSSRYHLGEERMRHDFKEDEVNPILAFSVLNAVGLVRNQCNNVKNHLPTPRQTTEVVEARTLGLDSVSGIESVSNFFSTFSASNGRRKCPPTDAAGTLNDAEPGAVNHNGDNNDEVCLIRGGCGQDELIAIVPQTTECETYGDDPLCKAIPPIEAQKQIVMAAVASPTHHFQNLSSGNPQQLTLPTGTDMNSLQHVFYSPNGVAGNETTNPVAYAGAVGQHPQLHSSLGIVPTETEETAVAIIPDFHQNAAATSLRDIAPLDALHVTALSSINPQNRFGFVASSPFQVLSNKSLSISSSPAFRLQQPIQNLTSTVNQQKKPSSLMENTSSIDGTKVMNRLEACVVAEIESPGVAHPPLATVDKTESTLNSPPKRTVSHCDDLITEQGFAILPPPEGLHQDVADLIAVAKFHDAHSLSRTQSTQSNPLMVTFLLSLSAAIPISKEKIANLLTRQLGSASYQSRLKELLGCSSSATALRNVSACSSSYIGSTIFITQAHLQHCSHETMITKVIVAMISLWLWVEHKDCCKRVIVETRDKDPNFMWLITLAIDLSLSALANFFDSLPSFIKDYPTTDSLNQQVAAITSESLSQRVIVDHRAVRYRT